MLVIWILTTLPNPTTVRTVISALKLVRCLTALGLASSIKVLSTRIIYAGKLFVTTLASSVERNVSLRIINISYISVRLLSIS